MTVTEVDIQLEELSQAQRRLQGQIREQELRKDPARLEIPPDRLAAELAKDESVDVLLQERSSLEQERKELQDTATESYGKQRLAEIGETPEALGSANPTPPRHDPGGALQRDLGGVRGASFHETRSCR